MWFHTRVHEAATEQPPHDDDGAPSTRDRVLDGLGSLLTLAAVLAAAAYAAWLIIAYQIQRAFGVPIGVDTPSHLWRTRVVSALGLHGLFGSSVYEYHANSANPDRIGLPVLGSVLGSVVHVGPWRLMFVASALGATVLAFAAWALARALAEPRWAAPVYAVAVAISFPFAITARSHLDNALVDGILVAAGAVAVRLARGEPGVWAGILLVTAGVVMHWPIGLMFVGIVGWYAVLLLPVSIQLHRGDNAWLATPSARVGLTAVVAGLFGAGALVLTPGAHVFSTAGRSSYASTGDRLLHWYKLPFTLTAGAVGAVLLWFQSPRRPHRLGLLFYAAWMTPILAGILLFAFGRALPVMRLVGVALPVVLLGAAAGVGLIKLAARTPGIAAWILTPVAVAAVIAVLALQAEVARSSFEGTQPMAHPAEVEAIRTAVAYLTTVAPDRKAVVAIDWPQDPGSDFGVIPSFRRIRAFAPGWYAPQVAVYLGDPANLLSGEETRRPDVPGYDATADTYWGLLEPWLTEDTVVMVLAPFYDGYHALVKEHPDAEIAPGVVLLRGPPPPPGFASPPPLSAPSAAELYRWIALAFLVVAAAGSGWAFALLRLGWADRLAFAPALGLAALTIAGFVLGYARVLVSGPAGRWMFVGVVAGGWAVALARWGWTRWHARPVTTPPPA